MKAGKTAKSMARRRKKRFPDCQLQAIRLTADSLPDERKVSMDAFCAVNEIIMAEAGTLNVRVARGITVDGRRRQGGVALFLLACPAPSAFRVFSS